MKIDVENIIRSKTNSYVPKFLINWLKKIVHQNEINYIIEQNSDKSGVEFACAVLDYFNISTKISGLENIEQFCHCGLAPQSIENKAIAGQARNDRFIFASNHPLGALEALAIAKHLGQQFDNKINFVTNELLSNIAPLKEIFTSVNVGSGKQNKENIEQIDKLFSSDNQIIIFPAGQVSRKTKGKIYDGEWKKMFVAKARQYQRDIVPIFCIGRNSNFFYNLANLRKFFGIKFNIELLFLPSEMFKNKNSEIDITIGKSISYEFFSNPKNDFEWAQKIREEVYKLLP